jgi:hypothetical protein
MKLEGELVDVFIVRGDGVNMGDDLIGVFTDEKLAHIAAIGRGNQDCVSSSSPKKGDGYVVTSKALATREGLYLISDFPFIDGVIKPDPVKKYYLYDIYVTSVKRKLDLMKFMRSECKMTLIEVKDFIDRLEKDGMARVPPSLGSHRKDAFNEEEVEKWADALVNTGIATLNIKKYELV